MGRSKDIEVRRYKSDKEYQKDAGHWKKRGYRIANVVSQKPRAGLGRIIATGGIGAIIGPPPILIVTYEKAGESDTPR